ncbi:protein-L-isoaspartate(D-aspartate) O-methyltransferase [Qipengyuania sp. CAU 1752]
MGDVDGQRRQMVRDQIEARGISEQSILIAFRTVPRECFVPENLAEIAYEDRPLPIGEGQTISQPYIVAAMIEAAAIKNTHVVLEVGAGSGFAAAIMSRIAAKVFAVERHEILARQARQRIKTLGYRNCHIIVGDGMNGLPQEAPFDAILVAARSQEVPLPLKQQLKINGRLIIPLGDENAQQLVCITRTGEDSWENREISPVRFVPLLPGSVTKD